MAFSLNSYLGHQQQQQHRQRQQWRLWWQHRPTIPSKIRIKTTQTPEYSRFLVTIHSLTPLTHALALLVRTTEKQNKITQKNFSNRAVAFSCFALMLGIGASKEMAIANAWCLWYKLIVLSHSEYRRWMGKMKWEKECTWNVEYVGLETCEWMVFTGFYLCVCVCSPPPSHSCAKACRMQIARRHPIQSNIILIIMHGTHFALLNNSNCEQFLIPFLRPFLILAFDKRKTHSIYWNEIGWRDVVNNFGAYSLNQSREEKQNTLLKPDHRVKLLDGRNPAATTTKIAKIDSITSHHFYFRFFFNSFF